MRLINQYVDGVLSGEIRTCELTRLAVERHRSDLEKQRTSGFPYYFDQDKASAAIDFFPTCLKHSIGDHEGMPFYLEPWQAFGVGMLFGWVRVCDECRRFRRALWTMGRKQGKSTLASGLSIQLASNDWNPIRKAVESVADVLLCATKIEQSREVIFKEILRMREQSDEIRQCSEFKYNRLQFPANHGGIRCIGSDRPFSGLNPLVVIVDEYHEFKDRHRPFIDTMLTASGARSQPLFLVTTTAGDDRSELYYEFYNYVASVIRGEFTDEEVFGLVFELDKDDDPLDEENWAKANPNLGVSMKIDAMRLEARQAKTTAIALNRFTRYHGNRLVSSTEKAFDVDAWDKCAGTLSDWNEADAIGAGIDLGGRDDLCGKGLVARFPTGDVETVDGEDRPVWRYEIISQGYITTDGERNLGKQPWAGWIRDGILIAEKYPISALKNDLIADCKAHYVTDVAYDPYNGQQFAEDIEQQGIRIASMAQSCASFNEPISDLLQAIRDGRVRHDGNPLLSWCVSNACMIRDRQDRWMYDKRDSREKIDLIVAVTMGYRRAMVAPARAQGDLYMTG